jgi:hypothetical protein
MVRVTGVLRQLQKKQTFQGTDYEKQTIVLETFESNTPYRIDFSNERMELLKDLLLGQELLIGFDIRGNYDKEDRTKVYNSLEGKTLKVI